MAAKLLFQLVGESTSAVAAFKKTSDASKTATDSAKTTGSTLGKMAGAIATGYAVKKVIDFGKSTVDAAGAAAHANKLVTATFKDAGDASGEAAKHAIELADSLGRQVGVSPNVIKGAEGILATFHSVSGAAGVQSGVFDRATRAAADLAAAGYGDMSTNAKALGKALEDPTKGLTALTKSGVNFTEAQKDQIKMMTAGKASAKELSDANLKVATSQKTYNDAVKKHGVNSLQARDANRKLANSQEDLAKTQAKGSDILGAQKIILGEVEKQVKGVGAATAGSGAKMSVAWEAAKVAIGTNFLPIVAKVKTTFAGLFDFITANASWLVPIVVAVTGFAVALFLIAKAVQAVQAAMALFKLAINGVKIAWTLLNSSFLASPLGLIIVGIVAVVAALVILYLKVDWFRNFVNAAFRGIIAFAQALWSGLVGIFNAIVAFFQRWGMLILTVLLGPWGLVFRLVMAAIRGGWSGVMAEIGGWVGWIARAVGGIANVISAPFRAAWGLIQSYLLNPLKGAFSGVAGAISSALAGVTNAITAPFRAAFDFVQSRVIAPLKSVWNGFANTINSVSISTPGVSIAGHQIIPAFHWTPPWHIPGLAAGGLMTRTGLVYAHAGEVISPAPAAARTRTGELVRIDHAHFSERVDVDLFGKRLAWSLRTAGV